LALWKADALAEDSGLPAGEPRSASMALAHTVDSGDEGGEGIARAEAAGALPVGDPRWASMALARNVDSGDEVVEVIARAEAAGATVLKPAGPIFFGGTPGYFADPAGLRWEGAWN